MSRYVRVEYKVAESDDPTFPPTFRDRWRRFVRRFLPVGFEPPPMPHPVWYGGPAHDPIRLSTRDAALILEAVENPKPPPTREVLTALRNYHRAILAGVLVYEDYDLQESQLALARVELLLWEIDA